MKVDRKQNTMAVFYSFYYKRDAWRVQQIINMGQLEGQPILNSQGWEQVKRQGDAAIEKWIDEQMKYKTAVVVLAGSLTATRPWVQYEIAKAWNEKRPLVGIRIHGLADRDGTTDPVGGNPFAKLSLPGGETLVNYVPLHTPSGRDSQAVHDDISVNLKAWVATAYKRP